MTATSTSLSLATIDSLKATIFICATELQRCKIQLFAIKSLKPVDFVSGDALLEFIFWGCTAATLLETCGWRCEFWRCVAADPNSGDAKLEMRVLQIEDLEIHACRRTTAEVEAADRWRG